MIADERTFTYAELDTITNQLANSLVRLGTAPRAKSGADAAEHSRVRDRVFRHLKTGAVVVPINVLYKAREIEFLLEDSEAVALIACTEFLAEALDAFRSVDTCHHLILVNFPQPAPLDGEAGVHRLTDLLRAGSPDF